MNFYLNCKDHSISKEEFSLEHDSELDMLLTKPIPSNLEAYYESEVYISHTDSKSSLTDYIYQWVKSYSLKKKVALINEYTNTKQLLDVGAGTGDFLKVASKKGWQVSGVEPNVSAREKALAKGISLEESLESYKGQKFQVITLWHVLEHLPDLDKQIETIVSLLAKDGTLIIAVPNFKSYDAQYYKSFWAAYDVPRHLWHFSRTAIKKIFAKQNMELLKTKPMIFDAYYVSLLSEKYKTGKQRWIAAFTKGFVSNRKAKKSGEYSSLIYILKKSS